MTIRNMDILSQSSQHIGVIATDQSGLITVFNEVAEMLLGYEANSLINKMNINTLLGVNNTDISHLVKIAKQTRSKLHEQDIPLANGDQAKFQLAISLIPGKDDNMVGLLTLINRVGGELFSSTDLIGFNTFEKIMMREFKRMQRAELPVSILKIGIDNAKSLSSSLDDQKWTACVDQIALTLFTRIQRAGDILARNSESEFLVLLPQTDKSSAVKLAEILRLLVQYLALPEKSSETSATLSIGIASMVPSQNDTASDLLGHTSQALTTALEEGGNCSRLADINCPGE